MMELVARVKALLRRTAAKAGRVIYLGALTVDARATGDLREPVQLSPQEFELCAF
jgi:DNA-binding response OmpR family regulator